ncbi:hypothetical protein B296_00009056 [Ensete ventricosum]|uniref:3-deoxy-manno-octulosonate cytidylyltransferase n=1 Tax=Ensete ventricosum TaxID=4639 RepID=A0A426ZYC1_ENSVE|nr:hypothetical protein B296_00009056 [Ensete ventricosum]
MAICAPSSSDSSSGSRAWVVHAALLGAAIAAAAGAHFYLRRHSSEFRSRVVGIIPARFASSRFQGKPLAQILGKPMIQVSLPSLICFHFQIFDTAVTSLKPEDGVDPNRVKCVVDNHGYAIYFSRGLIPFNKSGKVNPQFPYLLHLGIQSFDTKFLKIYPQLPPTPLQLEEDLEQLKVLENGYKMKVIKVNHDAHGVDTPEDVAKIEALMRERNIA